MIKYFAAFLFFIQVGVAVQAQNNSVNYPFQNTKLSAEKRIENIVSLLSLDEKIDLLGGAGVPRLGVRSGGGTEAIHGVVQGGPAWDEKQRGPKQHTTVYPQGYGLGHTWDVKIMQQLAAQMAYEARWLYQNPKYKRAGLILWSPNADLGRDIRWGRTEECYGEDAFLVGELTAAKVSGLQGNDPNYWLTASLMKHFLANSHENGRVESSSDFDDALFREYYAYPFLRGIQAGSNALMTAYNAYNGIPCTYHPILKSILQNEWKFDGIILTDGGAFQLLKTGHKVFDDMAVAAKVCIDAGVTRFLDDYKTDLRAAIARGLVTEKDLDANIKGNLRVMLKLGLLDSASKNPYANIGITDTVAPWVKHETKDFVRLVANKSVVLLKNEKQTLPLQKNKIKRIAVIGNRADEVIEDWYSGTPAYKVSALQGIKNAVAGTGIEVRYVRTDRMDQATKAAAWADVAIVCVGNEPTCSPEWAVAPWGKGVIAGEGREDLDRAAITLEQEDLVKLVYKANPNTVLTLISSFPYAINWSNEHLPAILHITQSCQELGNAVADVLFGNFNPAGRTTQTWLKSIDDLPSMLDYDIRNGRTYMYFNGKALYPFGHGLSYTSFEYSKLRVERDKKDKMGLKITVDIKNTGAYDGEEVVQAYVKFEGDKAAKRLKAFERTAIKVGETKTVVFNIKADELKLWESKTSNNAAGAWVAPKGNTEVMVGASSENIKLRAFVNN